MEAGLSSLQILRNGGELFEGGFGVVGDLLSDDFGHALCVEVSPLALNRERVSDMVTIACSGRLMG